MSERLDRVLDVLDVGLQGSAETGYGTDHSPGRCARCRSVDVADGDLCGGCRSFLLGDSDDDPARGGDARLYQMVVEIDWSPFLNAARRAAEDFTAAFTRMSETLASSGTNIEELLEQVRSMENPEPDVHLIRHGSAAYCPRHGATKGGTCLKCARGRAR